MSVLRGRSTYSCQRVAWSQVHHICYTVSNRGVTLQEAGADSITATVAACRCLLRAGLDHTKRRVSMFPFEPFKCRNRCWVWTPPLRGDRRLQRLRTTFST